MFSANGSNFTLEEVAHAQLNPIQYPSVQLLLGCLYTLVVVSGLLGNGLVIFVVARTKAMQTVTNLFIVSLALNDITICLLTVPITPINTFLEGWYFGRFLCHFLATIQSASVYISTWTLLAIAVKRYRDICRPFLPKLRWQSAGLIILSVWGVSLLISLPYGVFMEYRPANSTVGPRCSEEWPDSAQRAFGTIGMTVQFLFPLLVIVTSYVSIWITLRTQAAKGLTKKASAIERKRRTNRMLVAMVVVFGCCWLPLNLINTINDYYAGELGEIWDYYFVVFFLFHILAMSSACYNPFLYAWMSENFRDEFEAVLSCWKRAEQRKQQQTRLRCRRAKRMWALRQDGTRESVNVSLTCSTTTINAPTCLTAV